MQPAPRPEPSFLRVSEVAKRLQITPATLYDMIRRGVGPPIRKFGRGRMVRVPHEKFLQWLETEHGPKGKR